MTDFVQNTLDGLMIGSSYGLLALGFTLIFGVMRRLNLSYGPSIMVGAYLGTFVYVQFGASPIAVAALAVAGAVLAGTLSGGEQQMLAVARALMSRPRLLLMDEPSLGLAPLVVEEIFRTIAELHREGTTIFLVEQNAHMALKVAQRFYLMEQGRVTFSGDPGSLAEDEVIRRAYLGTARV